MCTHVMATHCYIESSYNYCPKPQCLGTNLILLLMWSLRSGRNEVFSFFFFFFLPFSPSFLPKQGSFQRSRRYKHLRKESHHQYLEKREVGKYYKYCYHYFKSLTDKICLSATKLFQDIYYFNKMGLLLYDCNGHLLLDIIYNYK